MEGRIELIDLDFEYKLWKNRLQHYLNELEIIKGRLSEFPSNANPLQDVKIEDLKKTIEAGNRKILIQEEEMSAYAEDFPITRQHEIFEFHTLIENQLDEIKANQHFLLNQLNQFQNWKN